MAVAIATALGAPAWGSGRTPAKKTAAAKKAAAGRRQPSPRRATSRATAPVVDLGRLPNRRGGGFKIDGLTTAEVKALSDEWDATVGAGEMTVGAFRAKYRLNKLDLYGLRARNPGRFQAVSRRVARLAAVDVDGLARTWNAEVATGVTTQDEFLRRNKLASTDLPHLRVRKPGAFGRMRGAAWIDRMPDAEVTRLASSWQKRVNGEGLSVGEFLTQEDLKPIDLEQLRLRQRGSFMLSAAASDAGTLREMKRDWKRVEAGDLRSGEFRDRWKLSSGAMSLLRLRNPGDFDPIVAQPASLDDGDVARLAAAYEPVTSGAITVSDFLREQRISRGQLTALRAHPVHGARFGRVAPTAPTTTTTARRPTATQVHQAKAPYARYHRGQLTERELGAELRRLGMTDDAQAQLRDIDPERFATRTEFRERTFDAMVDRIIAIARENRTLIRQVGDVLERADHDAGFVAAFGAISPGKNYRSGSWVLDWDVDRGGRLRAFLVDELQLKGMSRDGKRRAPGPRAAARAGRGSRNDGLALARELASALEGKTPGLAELRDTLARLAKQNPAFADHGLVVDLVWKYRGLVPELARWRPARRTYVDYRYVARWMQATHEAGPNASYEDIAAIFTRSPEYLELEHLPFANKAGVPAWLMKIARRFPGLATQERARRTYQMTRILVEAVRTAPAGTSLEQVVAGQGGGPAAYSVRGARHALARLTAAELRQMGFDPRHLRSLRAGHGLGEAVDPAFDPRGEPPGVDMELVGKLLEMPRVPPLLELALQRQDGRRVFSAHNMLLVNHLYSDAVPFVETLKLAGMSPDKTAIVSTEYPFDPAVTYALEQEGVKTYDDTMKRGMAAAVERGIREMLAKSDANGQPILILDDGGTAAELIRTKFAEQADRFKIVEITSGGLFPAEELMRQHGRLPFVYRTTARSDTKRRIMSPVYAARVIDTAIAEIRRAQLELVGREAVVLGGGAMGAPAGAELLRRGKELSARGLAVTFVDTDATTAKALRAAGFKVAPIEKALPRAALVVGMATIEPGKESLREEHLPLLRDGVVVVQGASKRKQFDMKRFEAIADRKDLLPGGAPRPSYRYTFGKKRVSFLADGWTINHNGSLHGSPLDAVQLELAIVFENMAMAAKQSMQRVGSIGTLSAEVQEIYVKEWERLNRAARPRGSR
ncbi:MAG TPA: hypothetical protein VMZ28_11365 [Kofleriaceae bacterium]|nr:hypothetical protein [Kofleriaceae bacterium]